MLSRPDLPAARINDDLLRFTLRTPFWFWLVTPVLALLVVAGLASVGLLVLEGLRLLGYTHVQQWSILITHLVFWVGISHAGVMISAILRLTHAEWRRPITRAAEVLAIFALITAALVQRNLVDDGRELLIAFDLVLVVVLALLVYSISARDPLLPPGWFDRLQLVMLVSALVLDAIVLTAMVGRIGEFGVSPNKAASLGLNLILLANLAGAAWLQLGFLRRRRGFGALERWQTGYLPVFLAWGRSANAAPVENADLWLRHLPGAEVEIFQGSADLPHVESSTAFCRALERFVTGLQA